MKLDLVTAPLADSTFPALALLLGEGTGALSGLEAAADGLAKGAVAAILRSGDFPGKAYSFAPLYTEGPNPRLLLAGLGKVDKLTLENVRDAAGRAALGARDLGVKSVAVIVPEPATLKWRPGLVLPTAAEMARAVAEGMLLSQYQFHNYRTKDLDDVKTLESLTLVLPALTPEVERAVAQAQAVTESISLARDWILHPGGVFTPPRFADDARSAGEALGLKVTIFDRAELERQGFRTLLAVGQGSVHEPRLIRLDYAGGQPDAAPYAIVGKGITFDTGGLGIKPGPGMEKMKYDMAGGATAIAIVLAAARLKLPVNVTAIVVAAENMPSATAIMPGDVVTSYSGLTIEINDTDAEGRLVLADALAYAVTLKPRAIVDMATLTGSVAVALGRKVMGVMGNDQALVERFLVLAERAGERGWQLPTFDEYHETMESHIADMRNYGGRYGDTVNAAAMLSNFVGKTPWLHLDIAGVGWADEARGYRPMGPTGAPLRAVLDLLASS